MQVFNQRLLRDLRSCLSSDASLKDIEEAYRRKTTPTILMMCGDTTKFMRLMLSQAKTRAKLINRYTKSEIGRMRLFF